MVLRHHMEVIMIEKVKNKLEIYKIANSGSYELLRESLITMDVNTSYDNPEIFDFYKYIEDGDLLGVFAIRKINNRS